MTALRKEKEAEFIGVSIDYAAVTRAASRLEGIAVRTPVLTSPAFDAACGLRAFFKCENFQLAGSFKFRGAYNAAAALTPDVRARGLVAFSSGNHAQAVALAGRMLGCRAVVVMPVDAPRIKRLNAERYGAEIISYDRFSDDREALAMRYVRDEGLTLIPPYDSAETIAGQGTAAKELLEATGPLDALFVCIGGGGLMAGSVLAARALAPGCAMIGVEPDAANDAQRSLALGRIVTIPMSDSIADGARTQALGTLTFPILKAHVREIVTVSDAALVHEMRSAALDMKLVVEPTGCLSTAGLRAQAAAWRGKRVGVIISGGNVDSAYLREALDA